MVGGNVADTVRKKLFDPMLLNDIYPAADFGEGYSALILACGMIAALIAAGTWLITASYFGLPVSTSHSIVGAVVGFGCVALGVAAVDWGTVGLITLGWVVSPLLSGAVAYILFRFVLRSVFYKRDPVAAAKRVTPYLAGCVITVLVAIAAFKGLEPMWENRGIDPMEAHMLVTLGAVSLLAGMVAMFVARRLVRRIGNPQSPAAISGVVTPDVSRSLSKASMHLRRVRDVADGPMSEKEIVSQFVGAHGSRRRGVYGKT